MEILDQQNSLAGILSCLCMCVLLINKTVATSNGMDEIDYRLPSMEAALVNKLLQHYRRTGKIARPTNDSSVPTTVNISLRVIQLDIDEKTQVLKTSAWVKMTWKDYYLKWSPADYDRLTSISLPWSEVWLPDIALVNTADTEEKQRDSDVYVGFMGVVHWIPHKTFQSACLLDITNYPYDQHTCSLWFQSMTHSKLALNLLPLQPKPWDMETYLGSYKESQEWEIVSYETKHIENPRDEEMIIRNSRRPAIKFTLTVRRRLGYTGLLLMLPCVLLASMSLVVFLLPAERPDRNSLAMSLFASFMVLLLVLVEVAPPTAASVPRLGVYYAFNMTLVMIAVFLSGIVIHISRLGDNKTRVPKVVKVIFIDFLARVLFMHGRIGSVFLAVPPSNRRKPLVEEVPTDTTPSAYPCLLKPEDQKIADAQGPGTSTGSPELNNLSRLVDRLEHRMEKVEKIVTRTLEETIKEADHEQDIRLLRVQWRNISLVLDRLCIIVYTFAIVISLAVLFPRPK